MRVRLGLTGGFLSVGLSLAASGCHFFFPTPLEQDVDTGPSATVRSVGDAFRPGERLLADVVLDGVVAGRGTLEVEGPCLYDDREVLPVNSGGRTAGLVSFLQAASSEVRSIVDRETNLPAEMRWHLTLGDRTTEIESLYDVGWFAYKQVRIRPDHKPMTLFGDGDLPIENIPHDAHTSIGFLRHWRPPVGTRGHVYTVYGRYPWRADLTFRGVEVIDSELGTQAAVRIDGIATKLIGNKLKASKSTPRRPFTVWFSDDDRKIPLRVLVETQFAKVGVELTGYEVDPIPEAALAPCEGVIDAREIKRRAEERKRKREAELLESGETEEERSEREEREEREVIERFFKR